MNNELATRFACVITDLGRMGRDNSDPMRYSKSQAAQAAWSILETAVDQAARLLETSKLIEHDFQDYKKELAKKQPGPGQPDDGVPA